MVKRWIGLIGQNGAGKSSVCDYLKDKGFEVISLSDVVRNRLKADGKPLDRDTLTSTANELKAAHGLTFFAEETVEKMKHETSVCFDSIRHPDEVTFLQSAGVRFIAITADAAIRYDRITSRKKETDHIDYETFLKQDEREYSGKSSGQNISACLKLCGFEIDNGASMAALHQQVDSVIETLEKGEWSA